ncbi:MAG TPA: helix-turn-helix domain-containing protein [Candidatus Moranbacteria bacterium]|nr:helix-turn-helix domain-containing protein [Candidatus Moranbacteria bacterium]
MLTEVLQNLGLSPNEAKIYEALLDLKESGVGEISTHAKVHRRNVYDAIKRLIDKGLVFPILTKGENIYAPVDPGKLSEIIKEKEIELNKILPELQVKYQKKSASQEAYIYRGVEGFKNFMRDMIRVGEDIYAIGAKLAWLDPEIQNFSEQIMKEIKRKKINMHILFDEKVKEAGEESYKKFGNNYRFIPNKYLTNSTINIFGDYVVNYTGLYVKKIDEKGTMFVIRDQKIADSYRKWFEFLWDNCSKK